MSFVEHCAEEVKASEAQEEGIEIPAIPRKENLWIKSEIECLYTASVNYSVLTGRPVRTLNPIDYSIISRGFKQTTSQCICKMQEILTSGSLKPGIWGKSEDEYLIKLMQDQKLKGKQIAKALNKEFHRGYNVRSWKTVRERWENYLNPNNNKGPWTIEEDLSIMLGYKQFGKQWSKIAVLCNNRTGNVIKNRFKSLILKEKREAGIENTEEFIIDRIIYKLDDGRENNKS